MGDHAVPLHLSEPETSVPAPALGGLLVEVLELSSGPGVDLVVDHMLESLVVGGPEEDLGGEHLAGEGVEDRLRLKRVWLPRTRASGSRACASRWRCPPR